MRAVDVTGRVVDTCPYCGSPFLRALTLPSWATCQSCRRLFALGRGERLPDVLPAGEAFVTLPAEQPADGPQVEGLVRVQRWTPAGLRCEHMAIRTPDDVVAEVTV